MYGNMSEFCLDRWLADISDYAGTDPWGPTSETASQTYYYRVTRGGSCTTDQNNGHYSSYRNYANSYSNQHKGTGGVRLCLTVYQ